MKERKLILAGTIGGLAIALGIAAVFSGLAASAQMMQHQGAGMSAMSPGMQMAGWHSQAFSGSGASTVNNVTVTGIAITGDKEATVYLRYTGAGPAPAVVVVAHTNCEQMFSLMHGASGMGSMQGMMGQGDGMMSAMPSMYPNWSNDQWQAWHMQMAHQLASSNSTQWQQWHDQMMANPAWLNSTAMTHTESPLIGSRAISEGWSSGTVTVTLQGEGSAYDASDIMAMVFPLTS